MVLVDIQSADTDNSVIDFGLKSNWSYRGRGLGKLLSETRGWDNMEIEVRYQSNQESLVQDLTSFSTKTEVKTKADGGFRGVDLSNSRNTFVLYSPTKRSDVRSVSTWLLDGFSKSVVSRDGSVYDLELELVPDVQKSFDNKYGTFSSEPTDSRSSNQWLFDFTYGNFSTRRVSASLDVGYSGTIDTFSINLILTGEQVRIFEENVSYLNLSRIRSVPDMDDVVEDISPDNRNSVSITTPDQSSSSLSDGEYLFRDWSTEWVGGAFNVQWDVVKK